MRQKAGDKEGVETLPQQAVGAGHLDVLIEVARMRETAGDKAGAEHFARLAADAGYTSALAPLARTRAKRGTGDTATLLWRHGLDPDGTPTAPW